MGDQRGVWDLAVCRLREQTASLWMFLRPYSPDVWFPSRVRTRSEWGWGFPRSILLKVSRLPPRTLDLWVVKTIVDDSMYVGRLSTAARQADPGDAAGIAEYPAGPKPACQVGMRYLKRLLFDSSAQTARWIAATSPVLSANRRYAPATLGSVPTSLCPRRSHSGGAPSPVLSG